MTPPQDFEKDFAPEFLRKVLALAIRTGLHQRIPGALDSANFSGLVEGRGPSPRHRLALLLARFERQAPTEWPGPETMDQLVEEEQQRLRPEEAQALQEEWKAVRDVDIPDPTFVEHEVREWHGRMIFQRAVLHAADLFQQGLPIDKVRADLQETLRTTDPRGSEVVITHDAFPVLGEAALSGLAGEFVRMVAPHSEADPAALLTQFLVMFGNVVGRGPHARAEADQHATNLFVVIVGETSKSRKGTAFGQVKAPFRAVDDAWASTQIVGGLSSGEGLIWAVRDRDEKPKKGKAPDTGSDDVDPIVIDKRLLAHEPEFASVLRRSQREGNSLSAIIRQAWDVGNIQVLTKNSPVRATNTHISIVAHVTKDELLRYLDRIELGNGFANRFLFCCARRANVLPFGGDLHRVNFDHFHRKLREALDFAWNLGPTRLAFNTEARDLWADEYAQLSEGQPGLLGAVLSRAEAQVLRLSLIYALLDQSHDIRRPHLAAALALWSYCEDSARYCFGGSLGDPMADLILNALRDVFPEGLSRSRINDLFARHRGEDIARSLGMLREQGLVRTARKPTAGRPVDVWYASQGQRKSGSGGERDDASTASTANTAASHPPQKAPSTAQTAFALSPHLIERMRADLARARRTS